MLGLVIFAIEYVINSNHRWIYLASLATALFTLWLAKSAGITFAILAIVIAAIVALGVEGRDRVTRHLTYRWAWAIAILAGILVFINRKEVFGWIGKSPDMTGRTKIWKLVFGLIMQRPVQGWGWLSYWVPGVKPYAGLVVLDKVPYYQAHNAYLDVWLQVGILGVILLLWYITVTFVKLWRLGVRHTNPLYLWPMLIFFGTLAQNLTESRMLIEGGWVLLILLGVKANDPIETLELQEPRTPVLKRVRLLDLGLRRNQSQQRKDR
jgi:O-antigen ligase